MLNLKKVIALVCVFALALTTVAFGATYADVPEDSAYYEAVETLTKLGIAKGTSETAFEPEAGVTRAQMAAFIARIQGYGETAEGSAVTPFTDVPADYWASGYIANAAGKGIINGYGDGTFGPENPVKYEEAVKMIMATLGYTPYADHNGGYPTGYLAAAMRYDVSLNVANAQVGTDANRGTIAQLLAKAIDTPLMEQVRWSTDGTVDYVICDGQDKDNNYLYKTLMSENLGYVKIRGVVMENTVTAIDNNAKTINTEDEAKVRVALVDTYSTNNKDFKKNSTSGFGEDGKTEYSFLVAGTDAEDFLGQSVVFYAKKVNDAYEIVSMNVDTVRNDVLVIAPDQFKGYSSYVLEYYKEGANDATKVAAGRDTDTVSGLDADPIVVYNGVGAQTLGTVLGGYVDNLAACKAGGQIKLIDNDSKPGYDVIFVELAGTAVVDDATSKLISFKEVASMDSGNVSRIKIDEDDTSKIVKIMKDGVEIEAAELAEWDVLSIIADGSNANYIVAEVISNPVVGTITGWFESKTSVDVDSDSKEDGFVIGGNKYDVVENVYGAADFKVGAGGTFYVNKYGKIAAFVEDKALALGVGANYGYVLDVASDSSFGKEIKVQMITADGVQVLTIKDNCTLEVAGQSDTKIKPSEKQAAPNDAKYVWGCDSDDVTNKLDASTYSILGLVQYTKTSEGLINSIKTPGHDAKLPVAEGTPNAAYEFNAEAGRFEAVGGAKINVDDDAIVFFVDAANVASKCSFGTYANLVDKIPYTIVSYFADDDAASNNIIVARPVSAVSPAAGLAVITEAGTAVDKDGNTIYELTFLLDGEEVSAKTIAAADLSSTRYNTVATMPAKGDVVQVEMNGEGVITGIKCVAYYAGGTLTLAEAAGTKEAYVLDTAKAFNKTKKIMTFEGATAADTDDVEFNFSRATKVYVIDATGRNTSIEVGGIGDYTYFKDLYECTDTANHKFVVDGTANQTYAQAVGATDTVLIRMYDDEEAEAVIIKSGTEDITPALATGC
ncbi:MAG: S-layer homology domain-containing protein [Clostridia bacterium]|nr:S-layer homology domain-containing protein [Clostridia bacterium]